MNIVTFADVVYPWLPIVLILFGGLVIYKIVVAVLRYGRGVPP